jgi:hypothetical protein
MAQKLERKFLNSTQSPSGGLHSIASCIDRLDLQMVMKIFEAVSNEIVLERVIEAVVRIAVESGGAERGLLISPEGDGYRIEAEAKTGVNGVEVQLRPVAASSNELPESLIR